MLELARLLLDFSFTVHGERIGEEALGEAMAADNVGGALVFPRGVSSTIGARARQKAGRLAIRGSVLYLRVQFVLLVVLYFAMVLPWFIAVQHQNPTFFREFFFEHNLQRFATDRYQHDQPFWYYLAVMVLALMPWTVIAVRALIDGVQPRWPSGGCATPRRKSLCPRAQATPFPNFWCCGR